LFSDYDFDPIIKDQITNSPPYEDKVKKESYIFTDFLSRTSVMVDKNIADHFNLDLRTPFLSESVIQTFINIPTNMKMHKKVCKYVVKEMLRKYTVVPYTHTKVGFQHPVLPLKKDKEFVYHFKSMKPKIEKLRNIARNIDQARGEFFGICTSLLSWYENLYENS
jgi:asparagine synthetase B (glutamine-hydrolysing)